MDTCRECDFWDVNAGACSVHGCSSKAGSVSRPFAEVPPPLPSPVLQPCVLSTTSGANADQGGGSSLPPGYVNASSWPQLFLTFRTCNNAHPMSKLTWVSVLVGPSRPGKVSSTVASDATLYSH
eukprot:TRINITY_DN4131_c0_g1_i21.p1 TRINITY_DN4131_c0_g1~~TRINITY_DN4131_c0_g1_i21.p1  ORF type:complete len:124 (-),score=13.04 TRINITY_DN4131_c0_g1_i21:75-446(-)